MWETLDPPTYLSFFIIDTSVKEHKCFVFFHVTAASGTRDSFTLIESLTSHKWDSYTDYPLRISTPPVSSLTVIYDR